jgi:hypothetical protein
VYSRPIGGSLPGHRFPCGRRPTRQPRVSDQPATDPTGLLSVLRVLGLSAARCSSPQKSTTTFGWDRCR